MSAAPSAEQTARTSILIPRETISITLSQPHDPDAFYRTHSNLYVYDGFSDRVVANAKPVAAGTRFDLNVHDLAQNATDAEIEAALPMDHRFDESAVCAIVAELIGQQPEGKKGHLHSNGYANLLYLPSCVALVDWYGVYREWHADTWDRDGSWWGPGRRVLSPA